MFNSWGSLHLMHISFMLIIRAKDMLRVALIYLFEFNSFLLLDFTANKKFLIYFFEIM